MRLSLGVLSLTGKAFTQQTFAFESKPRIGGCAFIEGQALTKDRLGGIVFVQLYPRRAK